RSWRRRCTTRPAACARPSSTSRGSLSAIRPARACCCTARPMRAAASASRTTRSPQARPRSGRQPSRSPPPAPRVKMRRRSPPPPSARWLAHELPFAPTSDQLRAIAEIDADLSSSRAMQRLLMGEVGSGKTVVALHAMLRAVEHGEQAALMAPTETLAEQHFATIQSLMPGALVSAALLTGSTSPARRREILARLASGELSLIVGTHAVIQSPLVFADLAVALVDEQHRFGVRQRAALVG